VEMVVSSYLSGRSVILILTVYNYSFNILIEEKLKSGNGGIIIFEWS